MKATGGRADKAGKTAADFPAAKVAAGAKVEAEHTPDKELQQDIAADHLAEDPEYYKKLKRMEAGTRDTKKSGANVPETEGSVPEKGPQNPAASKKKILEKANRGFQQIGAPLMPDRSKPVGKPKPQPKPEPEAKTPEPPKVDEAGDEVKPVEVPQETPEGEEAEQKCMTAKKSLTGLGGMQDFLVKSYGGQTVLDADMYKGVYESEGDDDDDDDEDEDEDDEEEASGALPPDAEDKVRKFLADNPNPLDSKFHEFAAQLGVAPAKLEAVAYKIATGAVKKSGMAGLDAMEEYLAKGIGGYKYIKREGGPGNYRYTYADTGKGKPTQGVAPEGEVKKPAEGTAEWHGNSAKQHSEWMADAYKQWQDKAKGAKPGDLSPQISAKQAMYHNAMQRHHLGMQAYHMEGQLGVTSADAQQQAIHRQAADEHKADADRHLADLNALKTEHGAHPLTKPETGQKEKPAEGAEGHAAQRAQHREAGDVAHKQWKELAGKIDTVSHLGAQLAAKKAQYHHAMENHHMAMQFHHESVAEGGKSIYAAEHKKYADEHKADADKHLEGMKGLQMLYDTEKRETEQEKRFTEKPTEKPGEAAAAPKAAKGAGKGTIKVPRSDKDEPDEVAVRHRAGQYAVHRGVGASGAEKGWTLTHVPSGMAIKHFAKASDAKAMANYLHKEVPTAFSNAKFGKGPGDVNTEEGDKARAEVKKIAQAMVAFKALPKESKKNILSSDLKDLSEGELVSKLDRHIEQMEANGHPQAGAARGFAARHPDSKFYRKPPVGAPQGIPSRKDMEGAVANARGLVRGATAAAAVAAGKDEQSGEETMRIASQYYKNNPRAFGEGGGILQQQSESGSYAGPPQTVGQKEAKPTIPEGHQTAIAKQTLKMPDAMAGVMGGPSKAEAAAHLAGKGKAGDAEHLKAMQALGVKWPRGKGMPEYSGKMTAEQRKQADDHYDAMSEEFINQHTARKSMTGLNALKEFAMQKAMDDGEGAVAKDLPGGESKIDQGHATTSPNGEEVDGEGHKASGAHKPTPGAGQDANGQMTGVDKPDEEILSDDDKTSKLVDSIAAKSLDGIRNMRLPGNQREAMAHENAIARQRLQKSEPDVRVQGIPHPLSNQQMHGDTDSRTEALVKSDSFYTGSSPTKAAPASLMGTGVLCKGCGCAHSAMLTSCPDCGEGAVRHQTMPGMPVGQTLRPVHRDADVYLPGPSPVVTRR